MSLDADAKGDAYEVKGSRISIMAVTWGTLGGTRSAPTRSANSTRVVGPPSYRGGK